VRNKTFASTLELHHEKDEFSPADAVLPTITELMKISVLQAGVDK
jgi:hypothetical protein